MLHTRARSRVEAVSASSPSTGRVVWPRTTSSVKASPQRRLVAAGSSYGPLPLRFVAGISLPALPSKTSQFELSFEPPELRGVTRRIVYLGLSTVTSLSSQSSYVCTCGHFTFFLLTVARPCLAWQRKGSGHVPRQDNISRQDCVSALSSAADAHIVGKFSCGHPVQENYFFPCLPSFSLPII